MSGNISLEQRLETFVAAKRDYNEQIYDKGSEGPTEIDKRFRSASVDVDEAIRYAVEAAERDRNIEGNQNYIVSETVDGKVAYFSRYTSDDMNDLEQAYFEADEQVALEILLSKVLEVVKSEAWDCAQYGKHKTLKVYVAQQTDVCVLEVNL